MNASDILAALVSQEPVRTADLPAHQRGIYGLIDHEGILRYIGSTSAPSENFRKRIHQRHRTGSETHSHYFSKVYCCGRMWRDRLNQQGQLDAKIAKDIRSAFIAEYCRAVYVPIDATKAEIEQLEADIIRRAPAENTLWNGKGSIVYEEPTEQLDELLDKLGCNDGQRAALMRQSERSRCKKQN